MPGTTVDVVDAFRREVESRPSAVAVEHRGETTTFEELWVLAARIAGSIRLATPRRTPRVLLALPQSASAYAGMIGTLIAGGTFCPVKIDGPEARNGDIAQSFGPDVILFDRSLPTFLDSLPSTTPRLDTSALGTVRIDTQKDEHDEAAYVVFTSGSSGQPKGVKLGRAGFSHFISIARDYFRVSPGERWGQYSNLGYDLAIMDTFLALCQGAALVSLSSPKEQTFPAAAVKERRIQIWHSVPSVIELMIRANQVTSDYLGSLRVMSFCGEPLLPRHLGTLFTARPDLEVFNTYGTTETCGFNTINRLTSANYLDSCEAQTVAIGDDVPGWTLSLQGGESADEGEVVVSSDHLGLGYWRDEDRTRDAFRLLRKSGSQNQRSYFTGDWGLRKNSRLYFLCRIDRQVKVRGERIELDEVDALLREAGFAAAYTLLHEDELYSFVESAQGIDQELVRARLAKRLPFHAVPKTIQSLAALPRNANGKIDRVALQDRVTG